MRTANLSAGRLGEPQSPLVSERVLDVEVVRVVEDSDEFTVTAGVCGGAVVPPILGAVADARSTAIAMAVPLCFFIAAETYAIAVNFVPAYVDVVDKIGDTK